MTIVQALQEAQKKWCDPKFTEVVVYTRPNLRNDEMTLYIGSNVCGNIFDKREISDSTGDILLMYPERFLNILEQRALSTLFWYFYPKAKHVKIITHSVYIIQCCNNKCLGVISPDPSEGIVGQESVGTVAEFVAGRVRYAPPAGEDHFGFGGGIVNLDHEAKKRKK